MPATRPTGTTYTITELAREFDITTRAIRFYEDQGLLDPYRDGRRRVYSRRDRTRLKLILRGKRLGFTLQESKELFDLYDSVHGEQRQLQRFLDILADKRVKLEQQRRDIEAALEEIDDAEDQCRRIIAEQDARAARGEDPQAPMPRPGRRTGPAQARSS